MGVRRRAFAIGLAVIAACTACSAAAGAYQAGSPQLHISVAAGCPHSLGKARDVHNSPAGLGNSLVPHGPAPQSALVCRYEGTSDAGSTTLAGSTRLAAPQTAELAAVLARVSLKHASGSFACPARFSGTDTVIALHYATRASDVDVWYMTSGCRTLDNGRVQAFQGANPSFYGAFQTTYARLVPGGD